MAQDSLQLSFADGSYTFRLTMAGIKEIQTKCGAGIGRVYARLHAGRMDYMGDDVSVGLPIDPVTGRQSEFYIDDIVEVIRQALIGGQSGEVDGISVKVDAHVANRLVTNYVVSQPLQASWSLAYAIVAGLIEGYDPPKKKLEAETTTETDGSITPEP